MTTDSTSSTSTSRPTGGPSSAQVEVTGRQTLVVMSIETLIAGDSPPDSSTNSRTTRRRTSSSRPTAAISSARSYYSGVSNIFRYDLESKAMEIVTNTDTGFFTIPLGGDSLLVFRYTGQGFVPALVTDARPLSDVSAITFLGARIADPISGGPLVEDPPAEQHLPRFARHRFGALSSLGRGDDRALPGRGGLQGLPRWGSRPRSPIRSDSTGSISPRPTPPRPDFPRRSDGT